jgi:heme/copper-type cytochrome/quinol oxidase subunit 3
MTAVAQNQTVNSLQIKRSQYATSMVGMILVLSSWAMMFGALFYSYGLLRIRAVAWPPVGTPDLPLAIPTVITVLLGLSAWAVEAGRKALAEGHTVRFRRLMMAAMVLGALFLALQSQVWVDVWAAGLHLDTDRYGSLFYFLTAFHAIHVVAGLGVLFWMFWTAPRLDTALARHMRAQFSAWFWHFVGAVWVVIYALVYVL